MVNNMVIREITQISIINKLTMPAELRSYYPRFNEWYRHFEDTFFAGERRAWFAYVDGEVAGFVFVKTGLKIKISSIYVYPQYRGIGVCTRLLQTVNDKILGPKHITVAEEVLPWLKPVLVFMGYKPIACVLGKYRENKREYVYQYL